ncbi:hypothetical protein PCASD_04778 [Puccinia coronata f. sp. avenae]|uniref:Uncharacterized protein n=1 Tax=Puccinia coronata f. sp. avenae TaxID=200324 RepID=A0A2N5V6Z8_9BASI|nr:hypothetical protein PCASD_04778 [Puccinia coronata f. sp. avenae]
MSLWILPKIDHALHVWASSTELVEYEDWARGDRGNTGNQKLESIQGGTVD